MKGQSYLDSFKVSKKVVTARQYLSMTPEQRDNVAKARPVPARLGSGQFGYIEIEYKTPVYEYVNGL